MEGLPINLPKVAQSTKDKRICSYKLYDGEERRNDDPSDKHYYKAERRFRGERRIKRRRS